MDNKEAISVLQAIKEHPSMGVYLPDEYEALDLAIKALEDRTQGEWYYNYQNGWHCSICHETVKDMPTVMGKADFNFCPNCGVKMKHDT